jgi:phenylalanyl-tRNA synthetase beta chain
MLLSVQWLRQYVALPEQLTPAQIQQELTMVTVEVEQATDLADGLRHVVVGQVLQVSPHPNANRLRLARCDLGGGQPEQIVCGGSNLEPGMWAAAALPGAKVRTRNGGGLVEIQPTEVRGVTSRGMLCSASELGLTDLFPPTDDHEILDLAEVGGAAGRALSSAIGFEDTILEIDNKSLTNRPDLWGHYGIARELAAVYRLPLAPLPAFTPPSDADGLSVEIFDATRSRRYTATRVRNVAGATTPFWMRSRLARVGQRPISFLVDLTNYVMLAVGQPSHAFDARLVRGALEVRSAAAAEAIELLDGKTLELDSSDLVIADQDGPVALAGVMGGRRSSIFTDTSELVLEVAHFEPGQVRRATARHAVRTDSSSRFEKGQDPHLVDAALGVFFDLLPQGAPDAVATGHVDAHPRPLEPARVDVTVEGVERRLGKAIGAGEIREILTRLGFGVGQSEGLLRLAVPTWRSTGDVSIPEDIVEEVARLYGYERLEFVPPRVLLERAVLQPRIRLERRLKEYLAIRCGLQEVMSYPWVEDKYWDAAGLGSRSAIELATPPAPDARRLQTSLVPSLLKAVALNSRHLDHFGLFELSRVFLPDATPVSDDGERLPLQPKRLCGALVGNDPRQLLLTAKGILEHAGRAVHMQPLTLSVGPTATPWADPAAEIGLGVGSTSAGVCAVVSPATKRRAGIRKASVVLFELDLEALVAHGSRESKFVPFSEYPQVRYDLNLVFDDRTRWQAIAERAGSSHPLIRNVEFVDEYRGRQVPSGKKSVTLRLTLGSDEATLTSAEVEQVAAEVVRGLGADLGGVLRS